MTVLLNKLPVERYSTVGLLNMLEFGINKWVERDPNARINTDPAALRAIIEDLRRRNYEFEATRAQRYYSQPGTEENGPRCSCGASEGNPDCRIHGR